MREISVDSLAISLILCLSLVGLVNCGRTVETPVADSSTTTTITSSSSTTTISAPYIGSDYDMGSFTVRDIWVDPVSGNNANSGASRDQALKTLGAAWGIIPSSITLETTGYRIRITPGSLVSPNYMELKWGTYQYPVIIQAADGPGTVFLTSLSLATNKYLYLIDLNITKEASGGDTVQIQVSENVLLRGCDINGRGLCQEVLKVNQCQNIYIENSQIYGPCVDNAIDFVAVQYGHITGNKIHDANDWVIYTKGGSAYLRIEGNEIYNSTTNGGYTAGQGTGFNYMVSPWIHYEAYNIKFINNVIHDVYGAGLGVAGGYNILLAYNTIYKAGSRNNQLLEVRQGGRSPDENPARLDLLIAEGGWGVRMGNGGQDYIPCHHVYFYNNIFYNPSGYRGPDQYFQINSTQNMSNFILEADILANYGNSETSVRNDLRFRGNVVWNNGGLYWGVSGTLESDFINYNSVGLIEPQMVDPDNGSYNLIPALLTLEATTIPDFTWADPPARPAPPAPPAGMLSNTIDYNYLGSPRASPGKPGAY